MHTRCCIAGAPFVESSSAAGSKSGLVQQMRSRISWMEKDLLGIHAMAAVIKKKGELAMEAEQYTLNELQKATESLKCEYPITLRFLHILECIFLITELSLIFSLVIALNLSEENKRVHERVEILTDLSQAHGVFWTNKSKVAIIAKF